MHEILNVFVKYFDATFRQSFNDCLKVAQKILSN